MRATAKGSGGEMDEQMQALAMGSARNVLALINTQRNYEALEARLRALVEKWKAQASTQQAIWHYVSAYSEQHGYGPTGAEICAHFSVSSPASAKKRIDALIRLGYVAPRAKGKKERLEVLYKPASMAGLSLAEALRDAGERPVTLDGTHLVDAETLFTRADVLALGWTVA